MHFVGLDLAWGDSRPTGVAVVDDTGRLVHVSSQQTDDDVRDALAPYIGDRAEPCLVAVDAPLVVANATGNRPCEAALNRDFARFEAGAHPANTGRSEFRGTPRGARIAQQLGLVVDAHGDSPRRAIEVYPHPAMVALFRLGRTLKYKNKPGRDLDLLRGELLRLTRLVETLAEADPPLDVAGHERWRALVAQAETATRKSELRFVEDQVDAVVCAYVALFALRRPADTTTYGDTATGFIVTPTLPADHVPGERVPEPDATPGRDVVVREAIAAYAAGHAELGKVTEGYLALVTGLIDDAGINYLTVTGRTKSVASYAAKAHRTVAGRPAYSDPAREITDVVGLRVVTYLRRDVAAVADLLTAQLSVIDDRDMGRETASQGRFGYASRHLLVTVPPDGGAPPALAGRTAQVQVRTVLQHAWAEFEHATRYKGSVPEEHASDLDRRFTLAAGLLELADEQFSAIHERLRAADGSEPAGPGDDPRISPEEVATFLTARFTEAGWSRPDHYRWVAGLLLELGISSTEELSALLASVDGDAVAARMDYRYPPGAVRRLDDALLAVFGERYLGLHGNAHRRDALQDRLTRLRSTAPADPEDDDGHGRRQGQ